MVNDNENVEQVRADINTRIDELWEQALGAMSNDEVYEFADRFLTAHKREMDGLRALVGKLANALKKLMICATGICVSILTVPNIVLNANT